MSIVWKTKGFNQIKSFFDQAINNGQLAHAYIFSGQEMIGKKTFALELTRLINDGPENVLLVDEQSNDSGNSISIEQIRKAKDFLALRPGWGLYKVLLVDNAHKMTLEAQNSFLKTLEEANQSSVIILISSNPGTLLETISSRCQKIDFKSHSTEFITSALMIEKAEEKKAGFLAGLVNGRIGLALSVHRQNAYTDIKQHLAELVAIKKASLNERFTIASSLADEKNHRNIEKKLLLWMLYLHSQSVSGHAIFLANLLKLNDYLGQSQYNRRLMFEEFMVNLG